VAFCVIGGYACCGTAATREGSKWQDLAQRQPGPPRELAVTVLPSVVPYTTQSHEERRNVEALRCAVLLNLQRHGFHLVPDTGEVSASAIIHRTDDILKANAELSPQSVIDAAAAVRCGKAVNAEWVLYGKAQPSVDFKTRFASVRKIVRLRIYLWLVDVESASVIHWCQLEDEVQGSSVKELGVGPTAEDSIKLRDLLVRMVNTEFDDIANALPRHDVGPEVTREQLEQLMAELGL